VKAVQTLDIALPSSSTGLESTTVVCTVSSDGKIHLYDMATVPENPGTEKVIEINAVAEYDSKGTRLTCVTLADGEDVGPPVNGKRKWDGEDASASEIEEEGSSDSAWGDDGNAEDDAEDEGQSQEEEELELEEDDSGEESD